MRKTISINYELGKGNLPSGLTEHIKPLYKQVGHTKFLSPKNYQTLDSILKQNPTFPITTAALPLQKPKPMAMRWTRIAFILAGLLMTATPLSAQTITFTRGNSYNVSLPDTLLDFLIPIELPKTSKGNNLQVRITDTKSDKTTDQVDINAFNNVYITDTLNTTALHIGIQNKIPLPPATYTLTLLLSNKTDIKKPGEKYTIAVTVNAAQLASVPTVIVSRSDYFFFMPYHTNDTILPLRESGKKIGLREITLNSVSATDAEGHKTGSVITGTATDIKPGGSGALVFKTSGDFPIGKTTVLANIISPQLADPVQVTLEVTTRVGGYCLVMVILGGLVFGFFVRRYLTDIINTNTAKLPGYELENIIEAEKRKRNERTFRDDVVIIENTLKTGISKKVPADITAAIEEAKKALAEAIDRFGKRLSAVQAKWDSLKSLSVSIPSLPVPLNTTTGNIQESLANATAAIHKGDLDTATTTIEAANEAMTRQFYLAQDNYTSGIYNQLKSLVSVDFKIPEISDAVKDLENLTFMNVAGNQPPIDTKLFATINSINFKLHSLLADIARQAFKKVSDTAGVLEVKEIQLPDPAAVTHLKNLCDQIVDKINTVGDTPGKVLALLPADLANLQKAMNDAIFNQVKGIKEAAGQEEANKTLLAGINTDMDDGHYRDAARKTATLVRNNPPEKTRGKGPDATINSDSTPAPLLPPAINALFSTASFIRTETQLRDLESSVEERYKATSAIITRARWTQTILSGIAITVIGFALHADSFMGTWMEIIAVFFWAFLLDVSVATITSGLIAKITK